MQFLVLGSLKLMNGEKAVALSGDRRRATLGLLLLNANREVATSKLLEGLWNIEETPATARKILQNAVRGLRVMFAEHARGDTRPPALLTCAHGYQLQVDPEQVDMYRFYRQAQAGRAELAVGRPGAAAQTLREVLGLWRGQALADLVETGHSWAELTALQSARLDVMEDYYEAELANGRHQAVLNDLEAMVKAEPLRERACHQLMLALYRSGRQTDALSVYRRVRMRLAEQFGLEPGRELRLLQHAILVHDPAIAVPAGPTRPVMISGPVPQAGNLPHPAAPALAPAPCPPPALITPAAPVAPGRAVPPVPAAPPLAPPVAGRTGASAMLIRADFGTGSRPADLGEALERTAATVREEVERLGGVVAGSTGSVTLALFLPASPHEAGSAEAAERAVGAAVSLRRRLCSDLPDGARPALRAAVATGEIPLRPGESLPRPLPVDGALLADCESLLQSAEDREIVVCGRTRRLTASAIRYGRAGGLHPRWTVRAQDRDCLAPPEVLDREPELDVLSSLLEHVRRRARPHLVLVLGSAGIGKSPLLAAFERRVGNAATVRLDPRGPVAMPDVAELAAHRPLVVFADDLHLADNQVLETVEDLLDLPEPRPLLVVAAARPELFRRRPGWGEGRRQATRMTLEAVTLDPVEAPAERDLPRHAHAAL
ncbi:DNA-binding transcriptional activator of the SARP family [Actinacidiphila yanglinensis]|uniref:DNA-binding transcriptional activator of the SARP family n=1 Tax=Actinacidiphila yanglinensis TaxID=310779 RepID=A0A1H6E2Q8_9ACTN|nr:BTAD domain-containing putative transcriptional regulator [Actinacidiphila yanglinensis]SEG91827.1 DNA-binding transcriptional activator of the SARP family [Actinacidiphila yanglinensis]